MSETHSDIIFTASSRQPSLVERQAVVMGAMRTLLKLHATSEDTPSPRDLEVLGLNPDTATRVHASGASPQFREQTKNSIEAVEEMLRILEASEQLLPPEQLSITEAAIGRIATILARVH